MTILQISDTHNRHQLLADLPAVDVLVHCGDDFVSNSNEVEFILGGKRHTVLATGQVHTHPSWNPTQTENPLRISGADINLANKHFASPNETIIQCLGKWKWTGFSCREKW